MKKRYFSFIVLALFLFTSIAFSQISSEGTPVSFTTIGLSDDFEVIDLIAPDINEFTQEDIENDENNFPQRIATNVPVNVDIHTSGSWEEVESGGKIWRIQLNCDGALALNVQFDAFYLPNGSNLFVYNEEKSQILGAFTSYNNDDDGLFSTELIGGNAIIIEYYEPEITNELIELSISYLAFAYRNVSYVLENSEDFGDSDWCQVNVNCSPEGNNWQDEKRGVARILYKDGSYWYWCTGSLVNNTLENGTPYFLTADHCGGSASASDRNLWIFYFNYESSGCSNPGSSPSYNSKTGATLRARGEIDGGSDFQLVQINSAIPSYYNVYYNGWDRSGSSSSSGVGIHHPAGDIKKISTYTSSLSSATWNGSGSIGATNAHWRTSWSSTTNGHGVTEGGSSGSPIFNSSGRVLGTLTGGSSDCNTPYWDLYGKFSYHWQSNGSSSSDRLRPWLDPNSSGVTYLDGHDPNATNPPVADFEADITTPAIGQTVNFTDLSSDNPTSWSWTFTPSTITYTGGTNSSSQNPQVQFNAVGNYTVSLTATNAYGSDNETKSNYISVSFFCGASGATNYLEIIRVELGNIDNSSGQDHYADYTYLSTNIAKGQLYDITITNGDPSFIDADLGIWIDWNQNGIFNNTDERVVCEVSNSGQGTYSFTVPTSATVGSTRMRIRTKYNGDDCGDPCGTTTYGEVEDYSVNILASTDPPVVDFVADNVTPGIDETVNFTDLTTNDPTSWTWTIIPTTITYVGGTTASSQNPQVQFNAPGYYSVQLMAVNAYGNDTELKSNYISASICEASGASNFLEITRVQLETIDNVSGQDHYADYTYLSTDILKSQSYDITITNGDTYGDADLGIWIDWDQNGGFNNTDELVVCEVSNGGQGTYTFAVPVTASTGSTRMRIRTKFDGDDCGVPCGTTTYGEVEDYSVNVILAVDPPVADFESDNTTPGIGETVNFTDLSTNDPTSWTWTFTPSTVTYVGGTNSASQNPEVQFDAAGDYTVELTATNISGSDTETKVDYVFVIDTPDADFEADNVTPGIGETVSFTDLSTNNPNSWAWTFTPSTVTFIGGTTASTQNPQVQFDAAGYYTVELIATNISGGDTETKVDYIFVIDIPDADFEADNVTPGIGETVNFTDLSSNNPNSWAWTFMPSTVTYVGASTPNDQNPQVTFDAPGDYTVELTATNISGSDTETKVDYLFVINVPVAAFEANNTTPGIGEIVDFTDLSSNNPNSWAWTFAPSTVTYISGSTPNDQNPQVTFDAAGYYTAELTATNISGSDSETKVDYIFVIDVPVANFEANNTTPGIGETVDFSDLSSNNPNSWAWTFTPSTVTYVGGTTASSQNPQVQFDATGYYTVELMATNISGSDTETKIDYINVGIPYIDLEITVFLEGPFSGSMMNTDLAPILPLNQPFNIDPWYYTGTESAVTIPGADIVDWVLVELRDATTGSLADGTTSFDWQAAFIRNDGNIVDIDGNPVLHFESTVSNSLFAVIHHRNHLSIMSANGIEEGGGNYFYDFSTEAEKAHGTAAQKIIGTGVWGMYGGEGNRNGQIDSMDKSLIWENEVGQEGYLESDYNLDAQSDNKDKVDIWTPNQGQGSQVPN